MYSVIAFCVVLGFSTATFAQGTGASGSGSAVTVDSGSGMGSGSSVAKPTSVTDKSLLDQLNEIRTEYAAYKNSTPAGKDLALAGLLAVLLNLALTAVKKIMSITDKGKKWLPWVATGLGILITILDKYALGGGWVQALIYGAAGPGAVVIQELLGIKKSAQPVVS